MIPFPVIVGDELSNDVPKVPLAQRDDAFKALRLDRPDKALRVRVAVRRRSWPANDANTDGRQ